MVVIHLALSEGVGMAALRASVRGLSGLSADVAVIPLIPGDGDIQMPAIAAGAHALRLVRHAEPLIHRDDGVLLGKAHRGVVEGHACARGRRVVAEDVQVIESTSQPTRPRCHSLRTHVVMCRPVVAVDVDVRAGVDGNSFLFYRPSCHNGCISLQI